MARVRDGREQEPKLRETMAKLTQESDATGPRSGQTPLARIASPEPSTLLDTDGVPRRLPVSGWAEVAEGGDLGGLASGCLLALLRFTRPDGSPVFGPRGRSRARLRTIARWAGRVGDPGLATVANWWMPGAVEASPSSPPLPADARMDRVLAVLRPDWTPRGDLIAVDHREPGASSLLEVGSRGQTWLGPTWTSPAGPARPGPSAMEHWTTGAFADCAEWSFRLGRGRVTRTLVLLRGRGLALVAQQDDGPGPVGEVRLALPDGIEATPDAETRSLVLSAGRGRPTARLIPIGLPASPYPTDRGSLTVEGREVVLRQSGEGRRRWLPLLVAWGKAPTSWRTSTVAHQSAASRPDAAFAARVAWGPTDDGLVVYRSLGPPALRCFLGHQTPARFLVGGFNASGEVRPYLRVDAPARPGP